MANDLNQCNFIGRLARDPESRTFPSGDQVCNVRIAVGSKWKTKEGELKESVEWVSVAFNGKLAEIALQYLRTGQLIFVSGQLRTRSWEQNGEKRYATEIRADKLQMLGSRDGQRSEAPAPAPQARRAPAPAPRPGGSAGFSDMDDDIPFTDPLKRRALALAI